LVKVTSAARIQGSVLPNSWGNAPSARLRLGDAEVGELGRRVFKIALKEMEDRVSLASVPGLSPDDIGPYRFNLIGIKHIIPWRHIALPVSHGIDKTCMGIARKVSQIDRPLRITHTCTMASRTVARK